ncbi:copia protein [Tanacetum coccineum]
MAPLNTTEAATICKSLVVYANEARQATIYVDVSGNANERGNVNMTFTPNVEQTPPVVETPLASNKGDMLNSNFTLKGWFGCNVRGICPWFIRNSPLILKKWDPDVNLFKEDISNVSVYVKLHGVPMTEFNKDGFSAIATKLDTPLILDSYTSTCAFNPLGWSSYTREMIKLQADEELKDTIVVAMPKLVGKGFYMCTVRVEYEWKPPRCSSCKVFGHVLNECPKNIVIGCGEKIDNPRQATRVFMFRWSIDNLECQIIEGKLMFVDDDGNPLFSTSYVDSESEVEVVFDETTNLLDSASSKGRNEKGYGNNSLLEQWTKTNRDDDSSEEEIYS